MNFAAVHHMIQPSNNRGELQPISTTNCHNSDSIKDKGVPITKNMPLRIKTLKKPCTEVSFPPGLKQKYNGSKLNT